MKYKPIINPKLPPFKDEDYKKLGEFKKAYKYTNELGEWIYCTACYLLDGKRNYHKFIYNEKENEWSREVNIKNNVLYNLDKIYKYHGRDIVMVDEESSISILEESNPDDFIFTTYTGTPADIETTDLKPLLNREVFYWSGSWMISKAIRKYIKLKMKHFIIVEPLIDRQGWNITDDLKAIGFEPEQIKKYIYNIQDTIEDNEELKEKDKKKTIEEMEFPFQLLGYGQGYMYILPGETGQILKIKQGTLNMNHLKAIAPLEFWQQYAGFPCKTGVRVAWDIAIDDVIRKCYAMGPFDKQKIRGRGAWLNEENNNLIIHTGKYLIEQNKKVDVRKYQMNGYVYERLPELKLSIKNEMIEEADLKLIIECFGYLAIETKLQLNLLIGWCVLAPFCGALTWRPHIWVTGGAGTGKSTIIQKIIWKMLGPFKVCPKGDSSAAGIFQYQTNDSLAICYDEAEASTNKIDNIRAILDIARAASSSGGEEKLLKGTSDQTGKVYETNSMFCLGSVHTLLTQKSDTRRFSVINLEKNNRIAWKDLSPKILKAFSTENCEKIRSYIYHNWHIVIKNIENFSNAAGTYLNEMGLGDQIGTLLAGSASLLNMKEYDYETCYEICKKYLEDFNTESDQVTDELECLIKIMTSKIRYINNADRNEETTLLNLINMAAGKAEYETVNGRAKRELYKYGINYSEKNEMIYIAINYQWIKDILKNTPWVHNYHKILMRLDIVEDKTVTSGFGSYYNGRAIAIKAEYIFRLSDDQIFMEAGF